MKRSALVTTMGMLGAAFALVGCGKNDGSEFAGSTPTKDTVALVVPAASSTTATTGALSGGAVTVRQGALLGDTAKDYVLTATLAYVVNTATGAVLGLVKAITNYPPSSVDGDTGVWGPYTDPLSANTYRLTVTRQAPHVFGWKLDGRGRTPTPPPSSRFSPACTPARSTLREIRWKDSAAGTS